MPDRIAYLILAHHQPAHLARLVRALDGESSSFFLHIDAKSDLAPFAPLARAPRVHVVERREKVHWGGFSQVQATLNLVGAAVASGIRFRRYCLLSGADFPIKPRAELEEALLASPREFMCLWHPLIARARGASYAFFVEHRHFQDFRWLNTRSQVPLPAVRDGLVLGLRIVNRLLPRRAPPQGLALFKGSQWWCLSDAAIRDVLTFVDRNPRLVAFFRTTFAADETFFQSIVASSRWADRAFVQEQRHAGAHGAHYLDWSAPGAYSPKTLDESDFDRLRDSPALFARKFDESRSAALLDRIEAELLRPRTRSSRPPVAP